MSIRWHHLLGLLLPFGLIACSTPAGSRYFSLSEPHVVMPAASEASSMSATMDGRAAITIHVQPVTLPAQVDRPQIVVSTADDEALLLLNQSVWAAPLDDEIRQSLSLSLAQALNAVSTDGIRAPRGLDVWLIGFAVNRFELHNGQGAVLEATWRLTPPGDSESTRYCRALAMKTVSRAGVEPLVQAQRTLLQRFSGAIAANIRGMAIDPQLGLQQLRCSENTAL